MHTHELKRDKKVIMEWLRRLGVEFHTSFLIVNSDMEDQLSSTPMTPSTK